MKAPRQVDAGALLYGSKAGKGRGTAYLPVKKLTIEFQMSRRTLPVLEDVASLALVAASVEEPVAALAWAATAASASVLSPITNVVLVPYSVSKALRSMRSVATVDAPVPSYVVV